MWEEPLRKTLEQVARGELSAEEALSRCRLILKKAYRRTLAKEARASGNDLLLFS